MNRCFGMGELLAGTRGKYANTERELYREVCLMDSLGPCSQRMQNTAVPPE